MYIRRLCNFRHGCTTLQQRAGSGASIVDLRSDTVTKPTADMRQAMLTAEVGDDVYDEDPTVKRLEKIVANMLDMPECLYFPTGTMSNLAGVLAWCDTRGSEAIVGDKSHIYLDEQAGIAQLGSVSPMAMATHEDGTFCLRQLQRSIRRERLHFPVTNVIVLENTHAKCGGRILPREFVDKVVDIGWSHKIPVHLDGSRIWNASVAEGKDLCHYTRGFDSVSVCLSKGLGAPMGSLLSGPPEYISKAKRLRKALGGGMRQVGLMAAAGIQSLNYYENSKHDKNLGDDHQKARVLGENIGRISGCDVDLRSIETNICYVKINQKRFKTASVISELRRQGVLTVQSGVDKVRLVTHMDVSYSDVTYAIESFSHTMERLDTNR